MSVVPAREDFAPGEQVELTIRTSTEGRPVPAEVEVAVVDRAVLALARLETPRIDRFFLDFGDRVMRTAGDFMHWPEVRSFRVDPDPFRFDYAIFGIMEEGADAAPFLRTRFPDTLHYQARVETDLDGLGTVVVPGADSLTTWVVVARGFSGESRFGEGKATFRTVKPVALRLAAPRFLVTGDRTTVTAVLRNDREETGE